MSFSGLLIRFDITFWLDGCYLIGTTKVSAPYDYLRGGGKQYEHPNIANTAAETI